MKATWKLTMGDFGQLSLYLCSDSAKAPLAVYRGFTSFQCVEDFYTYGLLAPAESSPGYAPAVAGPDRLDRHALRGIESASSNTKAGATASTG